MGDAPKTEHLLLGTVRVIMPPVNNPGQGRSSLPAVGGNRKSMTTYLNIAQIILGVAMITVILLQLGKSGGMGTLFGGTGDSVVHRTRRGAERTLFIVTVVIAVLFFVLALINAVATGVTS